MTAPIRRPPSTQPGGTEGDADSGSATSQRDHDAADLLDDAVALLSSRGWDGYGGPLRTDARPLSLLAAVYTAYQQANPGRPSGSSSAMYIHCYTSLRATVSARWRGIDLQRWERNVSSVDDVIELVRATAKGLRAAPAPLAAVTPVGPPREKPVTSGAAGTPRRGGGSQPSRLSATP